MEWGEYKSTTVEIKQPVTSQEEQGGISNVKECGLVQHDQKQTFRLCSVYLFLILKKFNKQIVGKKVRQEE